VGIRVARFPGEQCGHHGRVVANYIEVAQIKKIHEVAKIAANRDGLGWPSAAKKWLARRVEMMLAVPRAHW
jgi:hypothetical protein